jgi:hypothetical protein
MFKKIAFAAPLAVLALSSSMAFAVDPISTSITIKAVIPTSIFDVSHQNPGFGQNEVMTLLSNGELSTVDSTLNMKHTDPKGAINAFTEGDVALFNGRDRIPLTITIGGIVINETPTEVANEIETVAGVQRAMRIKADTPTVTQTGSYIGNLNVVFEPVLKP